MPERKRIGVSKAAPSVRVVNVMLANVVKQAHDRDALLHVLRQQVDPPAHAENLHARDLCQPMMHVKAVLHKPARVCAVVLCSRRSREELRFVFEPRQQLRRALALYVFVVKRHKNFLIAHTVFSFSLPRSRRRGTMPAKGGVNVPIHGIMTDGEKTELAERLAILYFQLQGDRPDSPAEFTKRFLEVRAEIKRNIPT